MKIKGQAIAPGHNYVTPIMISFIAIYFIILTVLIIKGIYSNWPSCEPPNVTSINTSNLTLSSIYPAFGNVGNETLASIRGSGFTDNIRVKFGSEQSKTVNIVDSTHLRVSVPKANIEDKTKLVDIVVTNNPDAKPPGKTSVLVNGFLYVNSSVSQAKPLIHLITPTSGSLNGGQPITIKGSGLQNVTSVSFGGSLGTDILALDDKTLVVIPPAHAEGKVDVAVSANNVAIAPEGYSYTCWVIPFSQLFLLIIFSGALGSCLHGLRSLVWHVMKRDLQNKAVLKYFLLPIIGVTFAVMFFLVISAGFYKLQGSENIIILIGLCAIVGMFSDEAAVKLKSIAEGLLSKVPSPDKDTPITLMSIKPQSGDPNKEVPVELSGEFSDQTPIVHFGNKQATVINSNQTSISVTTPKLRLGEFDVSVINENGQSSTKIKGYKCIKKGE
jgi:hypothetical protein